MNSLSHYINLDTTKIYIIENKGTSIRNTL